MKTENIKGWKKTTMTGHEDNGDIQLHVWYKKGNEEIEVLRFYKEDEERYDDGYSVMEQLYDGVGSYDGKEIGYFETINWCIDFIENEVLE